MAPAPEATTSTSPQTEKSVSQQPTSFAGGRYEVCRFLGEGGTKRVFLAHDTRLDGDVAFALIRTDGLNATGRERIPREAVGRQNLIRYPARRGPLRTRGARSVE